MAWLNSHLKYHKTPSARKGFVINSFLSSNLKTKNTLFRIGTFVCIRSFDIISFIHNVLYIS
jgi:hypothetical protein